MKARVHADYPIALVRAFGGYEFVRYELREIPENCQEEASRLAEQGLLELRDDSSPVIPADVAPLREEAKAAGIARFWQKKPETLMAELAALDEEE
jgi:hypothetical protein